MLRLSMILSLRNLFHKNRLFTFITIGGLAVGLACFFLVSFFVHDEHTFDRYHKNADRIYRIILDFNNEGTVTNWAKTSAPIGHYLSGAYPEVEQVVRIRKNPGTDLLGYDDVKFYEERILFADSTLFKVFDFKLIKGNPERSLNGKNNIILSEKLAQKIFGNTEVLGKSIRYNNQIDLKITGVMEDMPANAHFISDAFITFSSLNDILGETRLTHWGQFDHYTYILLSKGSSPQDLEFKLPGLLKKNAPEWVSEKETLFLQPLTSIHLHSDRKDEITPNSKESYSYILATIAIFILLMASANFVNLSTATQITRNKEIAIRKILGATSNNLMLYFWSEAFIISLFSLLVSLVFAYISIPFFNFLTNKQISLSNLCWPLGLTTTAAFMIAFFTGLFPAIKSLRLNASGISRPNMLGISRSPLRSVLITFQFFVSIFLIIATVIVSNQISFLQSSQLGFDGNDVIVIPIKDRSQNDKYLTIINEIVKVQGVSQASFSSSTPGTNNSLTYTYTFAGTEAREQTIPTFIIDENFVQLYDIQLIKGSLLKPQAGDTLANVVINAAAVKQYNLTAPIGQMVTGKIKGRIVGVVENFNHSSLHDSFQPVIMYTFNPAFRYVSVKLPNGPIKASLTELEKKWQEWFPGFPMEYAFLTDQNNALYESEQLLNKAYTSFSRIAILMAGIGLIGLTSYLIERRKRQISIRKVFGGTSWQMVQLIYASYIPVILISTIAAWAAGYYWMQRWLSGFANRIDLNLTDFILPTALMIVVLLISTGFQSLHASLRNPVDNLRNE